MPSAKRVVRRDIRRLKRAGFSPYVAARAVLAAAQKVKATAVFYGVDDLTWPDALIDEAGIQTMHYQPKPATNGGG